VLKTFREALDKLYNFKYNEVYLEDGAATVP